MTIEEFFKKYGKHPQPTGPRQQVIGKNGLRYRIVRGKLVLIVSAVVLLLAGCASRRNQCPPTGIKNTVPKDGPHWSAK